MKTIAFFNNKGGVGTTSLVYHLSWMFADLGVPVLAADLDPQASLTTMFLDHDRLASLWPDDDEHPATIYGAVRPILRGAGDIAAPPVEWITKNLGLLPGDLGLSLFEAALSRPPDAAFAPLLEKMAKGWAKLVLIDLGPNLGLINRAALFASDHVCLPLVADLYSRQALKTLGAALTHWRASDGLAFAPCGYVVMGNYPLLNQLASAYRTHILNESSPEPSPNVAGDPNCLAQLKHYRSLMPLAMEAHKPMFELKPADGAIGAHFEAVRQCRADFLRLATAIAASVGLPMPSSEL